MSAQRCCSGVFQADIKPLGSERLRGAGCAGSLSSIWLIGPQIMEGSVNMAVQVPNELQSSVSSHRAIQYSASLQVPQTRL